MREKILKNNVGQTTKRIIAFAVLLCCVVTLTLSQAFVMLHAGHMHDDNGAHGSCVACAQIQSAENLLRQLATVAKFSLPSLIILTVLLLTIKSIGCITSFLSLVSLKIKLNN